MTYTDLLSLIDTIVYENVNEDITADLMNGLLKNILNYANVSPTGILFVDPINGDDDKAIYDKRIAFKTPAKALDNATEGSLVVFMQGIYYHEKGNWARKGVYLHFMHGAIISCKSTSIRPFDFKWGGNIVISGNLKLHSKVGYSNSVNGIYFPINIDNSESKPAIVSLELDELVAHNGGLNIRNNVTLSNTKIKFIGGGVNNYSFRHRVPAGKHFFDIDRLDLPEGNLWAGTTGYFFTGETTSNCLLKGRIKELTVTNNTALWSTGVGSNWGSNGTMHSQKKVDIRIDRMIINTETDGAAYGYYQQRYSGTAKIDIGEAICTNKGIAAFVYDDYYHNSFSKLNIEYLKAENRAVKVHMHTESKSIINITDGYSKSPVKTHIIELNRNVDGAGYLRLSGWIKNDNGIGVEIVQPIGAIDINKMVIECTGDYSINSAEPDQKIRIISKYSADKPLNNILINQFNIQI